MVAAYVAGGRAAEVPAIMEVRSCEAPINYYTWKYIVYVYIYVCIYFVMIYYYFLFNKLKTKKDLTL